MVWGVSIFLEAEAINKCYFDNSGSDDKIFGDKVRKKNQEGQRLLLAEHHAPPGVTPKWICSNTPIHKESINIKEKSWLSFINSHLCLSQNNTLVGLPKEILIAFIMDGLPLNVGEIMFGHVTDKEWQITRSKPFPCMITRLCKMQNVPAFSQVDKLDKLTQVTDIYGLRMMKIQKRSRKKWSPTIPLRQQLPLSPPILAGKNC